jgi:hypothetical protein
VAVRPYGAAARERLADALRGALGL